MSGLDKHILAEQWRPDRKAKPPSWSGALTDLIHKHGRQAVAGRMNMSAETIDAWRSGKLRPSQENIAAIQSWWGEDKTSDMDDATIYFVQALRSIERDATLEEPLTTAELTVRMESIREMTGRTMQYLKKRISAPI